MTTFAAPAIPFGLDSGLPEDASLNDYSLSGDMTADPLFFTTPEDPQSHLSPHHWHLDSHYHTNLQLDDARCTGVPGSLHNAAGSTVASSSRSPASLILTPVSTLHEDFYSGDAESRQGDSDNALVSPTSNISPVTDESFYLRHMGGADLQGMDSHHPFQNNRCRIPSSLQNSVRSSVPQSSSHQSRASSIAPSDAASHGYWQSIAASTGTSGAWINEQSTDTTPLYDNINTFALPDSNIATSSIAQVPLTHFDPSLSSHVDTTQLENALFRPLWQEEIDHFTHNVMYQNPLELSQQQPIQKLPPHVPINAQQPATTDFSHSFQHTGVSTVDFYTLNNVPHVPSQPRPQLPALTSSRAVNADNSTSSSVKRPRTSRKAVNEKPHTDTRKRQNDGQAAPKRGGRKRESHLPDHKRQTVSKMRKTGACWRCVLQRDPCPGDGTPCQRCLNRAQKGPLSLFPCDRTKLPDLILDFLPPSMTSRHSKQSIEDDISRFVAGWDVNNGIDIFFSCGYGPPLKWRLYEFQPRDKSILGQLYFGTDKGAPTQIERYSPPFALLKLDTSDDLHFEEYVDSLMEPQLLEHFAQACYWEEELEYKENFQTQLLSWMCKLYLDNSDNSDLRPVLKKVIRMLVITYIMGHTLTITDATVQSVISSVRHSPRGQPQEWTSCRMANRQFKFFFSIIRNNLYVDILNWLQQTLHSSGSKDATWLGSFCVILGISMVLEELQRLLFIMADGSVARGEKEYDAAQTEATNACHRIDARHRLLVNLFQYKYRDKKWKHGSFGNNTPELANAQQHQHVRWLYRLLIEKQAHLQSREMVPLDTTNQCLFTSRLVGQFLLPFLRQKG